MIIRPATLADIPAMVALASAAAEAAHWSPESYRKAVMGEGTSRLALVLEESSHLCGFLVGLCCGSEWEIENLAVAEGARRGGLGSRLLCEFLEHARAAGVTSIFLEVRESNLPARSFYEALAFAAIGRRRAYYADPIEDAVVYRLPVV